MTGLCSLEKKRSSNMTELPPRPTTKSLRSRETRSQYLRRLREATESEFRSALTRSEFSLVDPLPEAFNRKTSLRLRCSCGGVGIRRIRDVLDGVNRCRRCANLHAGWTPARAAAAAQRKVFVTEDEQQLARIAYSAKQRCDNPNVAGYKNYGGRDITFDFPSPQTFVRYVQQELGACPKGHTLDRIDNNGNYAPGNLRWADRYTQRMNQREHYRGGLHFERINKLCEQRPDYSRESIRSKVAKGLSDDEILRMKKGAHYGYYKKSI